MNNIDHTFLLIGASGHLGGLVAATLLLNEKCKIVAPIRSGHTRESIIDGIKAKLVLAGHLGQRPDWSSVDFNRLITIPLPPLSQFDDLLPTMKQYHVGEILHCAGSVEYFNSQSLQEANIDLTNELISIGKKQNIKRFVFLSTAFSSGYINRLVTETLHDEPAEDPTEYTKSKRQAETLVAESELPYLIIRPSIVIGDSVSGCYAGKAYGLYQFWSAFERFQCDRYRQVLHFIAPESKLHLVHQDAFLNAFLASLKHLPDNNIINIVSAKETLPSIRQLTQLWCDTCMHPETINYYNKLSDVSLSKLDHRTRMWLEFTAVNSEIAAHDWRFDTTALDQLKAIGLDFTDATLDSVQICQDRFIAESPRLKIYLAKNPAIQQAAGKEVAYL